MGAAAMTRAADYLEPVFIVVILVLTAIVEGALLVDAAWLRALVTR